MLMKNEKQELYQFCLRCGRKLKTEESQKVGMGKTCAEKSRRSKDIFLFEICSKNT